MRLPKGVADVFIKTTRANNYEYIKLVESYRESGTTKHRVLYNFGRADLIKRDASFLNVVRKLCEIMGIATEHNTPMNPQRIFGNCGEAELYNYGYLAYLRLWKDMGIETILEELQSGCTKTQYSIADTVFLMAVQQLLNPGSKLATYRRQNRYVNLKEISLQHLYRSLDKLCDWKEDIETELFKHNYIRMNQKVDVVFYDVTTFAFESVVSDGLRDFGYSKDCKFNEVQVVMGMIIDTNGMPVGYELFPGNTFDGKTMVSALQNIQRRFGIHRVIIVADRGINSKNNLNLIKKAGYGYIMSSRIKKMGAATQAQILGEEGFTVVTDSKGSEDFRYKTLPYTHVVTDEEGIRHQLEENLIVSYSPKRAKKDRKDRERLVEKAAELLKHPERIKSSNKRGGKKYIDPVTNESMEWTLASEKIEKDARFDGYYGIQTSELSMTATDVVDAYHTLWKIEESFRIMKSTMEVRPVFHWTPDRIRGHFVLCFLAFLTERKLELVLKGEKDEISASPDRIQESLNAMQLTAVVTDSHDEFFIRVKPDPLGCKIFRLLKMKLPQAVNKKDDLAACFRLDDGFSQNQISLC